MKLAMIGPYPLDPQDHIRGGVVNVMINLCNAIKEDEDIDLFIITSSKKIREITNKEYNGISITYLPDKFSVVDHLLGRRLLTGAFQTELKKLMPDIVHAQGNPVPIFSALGCQFPHVVTIHGIYKNEMPVQKEVFGIKNQIRSYLFKKWEKQYTGKIKNLIATTDEVVRFAQEKSQYISVYKIDNPINPHFFMLPNKEKCLRILFVAQLVHRKGLHLLFESFNQIKSKYPSCQIRIVGSAQYALEYKEKLQRQYKHLVDNNKADFLGGISQEKLYQEYSECSLFCLPSLAESSPLVIAQAMAAGKPVIASRVGGIPAMVKDG